MADGFPVPDLTERNILSLLASAAGQDRLIQLPISGKTRFGCAYARRGDGERMEVYGGRMKFLLRREKEATNRTRNFQRKFSED